MNTTTGPCPQHPFGHDWTTDPLRCTGCGTTRAAAEAITSLVASVRGRDEKTANRLLCTFRDAVRADLLDELRHTPNRQPTPAPQTSGPICTEAEARDAGLDIAPGLGELTAMADTIVATAVGTPAPAVDLARAVPLMAASIERLRARVAELEQQRSDTRAQALREAAGDVAAYCPDHGTHGTARMTCHCEIADELLTAAAKAGEPAQAAP